MEDCSLVRSITHKSIPKSQQTSLHFSPPVFVFNSNLDISYTPPPPRPFVFVRVIVISRNPSSCGEFAVRVVDNPGQIPHRRSPSSRASKGELRKGSNLQVSSVAHPESRETTGRVLHLPLGHIPLFDLIHLIESILESCRKLKYSSPASGSTTMHSELSLSIDYQGWSYHKVRDPGVRVQNHVISKVHDRALITEKGLY